MKFLFLIFTVIVLITTWVNSPNFGGHLIVPIILLLSSLLAGSILNFSKRDQNSLLKALG
jgi:hypothetical protein